MGNYSSGPGTGDAHVGHPDQYFPKGPSKPKTDGGSYTKGGGSSAPKTSVRPKARPTDSSKPATTPKSGKPGKKYTAPSVKSGKPGKKSSPKAYFYNSKGSKPKADTSSGKQAPKKGPSSGSKKETGPMRFAKK